MPDNSKDLSQYGENGLSGIYRAFVVDNMDPLKLARVRIRVPMIHGVSDGPNYLNDAQVPWATPITPAGSGYDHGSCMVPDVGDLVFVMFEDGDRNYPLYLGGCYGKGGNPKQYGTTNDYTLYNGTGWASPANISEVPTEVYNSAGSPTGKIIYKSPKGATIWIQEEDGKESIKILDALGQSISLMSSLTKDANSYNGARRSDADAHTCTHQNSNQLCNGGYAEIAITGANNQFIRLSSSSSNSSIGISSGKRGAGTRITMNDDKEFKIALKRHLFRINDNTAELNLGSGQYIHMNADGSIYIKGSAQVNISPAGDVSILSPSKVEVQSNSVEISTGSTKLNTGPLDISASNVNIGGNSINLKGPVDIKGNCVVHGDFTNYS